VAPVDAEIVRVVGSVPESATHWGLQRGRPGEKDERKGWSTLAFPADESGVCRHEISVHDLSLEAIREASEGAAGRYRIKWLCEDDLGATKQLSFGRTFTLAAEASESATLPAAPRRLSPATSAPPGQGPDIMMFFLEMMKADREAARLARETAEAEARDRREDARRREERDREDRERREKQEREDRQHAFELERERLRAEVSEKSKANEALATIAKALEAQTAAAAALSARLEALEAAADEDEEDEDEGEESDAWNKIAQDLAPVAKRGAEALVNALGGAAE
jgi:hypothetical protein